ncbi:ribosomal RNA-processing protein 17 [Macadamia integrifolia]|uniref:ribosomal RNA-processing protein 17 n=1 Tax=Macadamia integrifolia TaxID=60698 RepID=UPI001C4FE24A|nr:ribosomal RNA-processing protein 17 [Macadamia integrifolia]
MMEGEVEGASLAISDKISRTKELHIKKRALRNKSLSVTFNDKDLRDYVSGFHKRKKKRRKEAQRKLQEKDRLKRIGARKQRKLEREHALYGGVEPSSDIGPDELGDGNEQEEETELTASVSGTKSYDNGDMKITVTTSEISHEYDEPSREKSQKTQVIPRISAESEKKHSIPVQKRTFKNSSKHKTMRKPQKRQNDKDGKKKKKH